MKHVLKILAVAVWVSACSGGGGGGSKGVAGKIDDAYDQFASKDYTKALAAFEDIIASGSATLPQLTDVYTGAAWCRLRLGNLDGAVEYYAQAGAGPDAQAGWSFAAWGLSDPATALSKANAALAWGANYVFAFDDQIDFHDLLWIQAASYYQLGQYANCITKIQALDGGFTANASDPNIASILAAKLQTLGAAQ